MYTPYPSLVTQYKNSFSDVFLPTDMRQGIEDKNPETYVTRGKYLLGSYLNDTTSIRYSDQPNYTESRLYAAGKQDNVKYMDLLCPRVMKAGQLHGRRKTWMNISWDIFPAFVRIRQKLLGYLLNFDYYIAAFCDDEMSDADRNELKMNMRLKIEHGEFMQFMEQYLGTGNQQQQSQLPFQPKSLEEIQMIEQMGGFKLWQEIAMELYVGRSLSMSDWDEIQYLLKCDLIDLAVCVVKDYLDPFTSRPKIRYCDPQYTIIRQSVDPSSKDITEAGEIKFYTAADLMRKYPEITPDKMVQAVSANRVCWGNQLYNFGNRYNMWNDNMNMAKIAVLEYEFMSTSKTAYTIDKNKNGVESVKPFIEPTFNPYPDVAKNNTAPVATKTNPNNNVTQVNEPRWYEASWIIGTNIVYNYGARQNTPYTWNSEKCNSSYTMFRAGERSVTDICKATIDSLQMNVFKTRNAEIKARPSGIIVDWSTLLNMTHGGEKLTPFDMLKIGQDTGNFLYKGRTLPNGQPVQGITNAIIETKGGMGQILADLLQLNIKYMNDLRDLTGFPALLDATGGTGQELVGNTKIAAQASDDVIRPVLFAFRDVKKRAIENLCMRWQSLSLLHPEIIKTFASEVGDVWTNILSMGNEMAFYKYSIRFEAEVSPTLIADIKAAALVSMQAGKAGQPGIAMSDYIYILRVLETGNVKLAQLYLSYKELQAYEMQAQMQQQNMAMNAKSAQDLEAAKSHSAAQQQEAELVMEDHKINTQAAADIRINQDTAASQAQLQKQKTADDLMLQEAKYNREKELVLIAPKPATSK